MHGAQASKRHVKGAGRRRSSTAACYKDRLAAIDHLTVNNIVTLTLLIVFEHNAFSVLTHWVK